MKPESTRTVKIATRKSALALWQAETTKSELEKRGVTTTLLPIVTTGDKMQKSLLADVHVAPSQAGEHVTTGKGLFVKEIQESLLQKEGDVAVHSMKDLPVEATTGLEVCALLPRADARDVIVLSPSLVSRFRARFGDDAFSLEKLEELAAAGSTLKVGTASARRSFLLREAMSNVKIEALRGNVDTRLRRVRAGEFDFIVLAKAGLDRLKLFSELDMFALSPSEFIPAPAQGIVAIEVRVDDVSLQSTLAGLNQPQTLMAAALDRLVLHVLGGDCHMALASHFDGAQIRIAWEKNGKKRFADFAVDVSQVEALIDLTSFSRTFCRLVESPFFEELRAFLAERGFDVVS